MFSPYESAEHDCKIQEGRKYQFRKGISISNIHLLSISSKSYTTFLVHSKSISISNLNLSLDFTYFLFTKIKFKVKNLF